MTPAACARPRCGGHPCTGPRTRRSLPGGCRPTIEAVEEQRPTLCSAEVTSDLAVATHPGPLTAAGEHFVAVASAIPPPTQGEVSSLDNYAATASVVPDAVIFAAGFESGGTGGWSAANP